MGNWILFSSCILFLLFLSVFYSSDFLSLHTFLPWLSLCVSYYLPGVYIVLLSFHSWITVPYSVFSADFLFLAFHLSSCHSASVYCLHLGPLYGLLQCGIYTCKLYSWLIVHWDKRSRLQGCLLEKLSRNFVFPLCFCLFGFVGVFSVLCYSLISLKYENYLVIFTKT